MKSVPRFLLGILLLVPRILLLLADRVITNLYKWIHKEDIALEKNRVRNIEEETKSLREQNKILEDKNSKLNRMFDEISEQIQNGKLLLGTHRIRTGRNIYNPVSKEYDLPEVLNVYFMYHEKDNPETFFIRAHYAGQIHEFRSERSGTEIPSPENQAHIFLIEGRFQDSVAEDYKIMHLDQLNTRFEYRQLGIATTGLDYLKDIASYNKVKTIYGEMGADYEEGFLPKFYKNRGFEVYGKNNDLFKLNI